MNRHQATVLIVDDEPLTRKIIKSYLAREPYELFTAKGGHQALEILEQDPEKFDVILLDRRMPDLDGLEVLKRIKKHPVLKSLPVIMQTAAKSEDEVVDGLEAGAYYYLIKPYTERVLCPIVRTALEDRIRCISLQQQLKQSVRVLGLMRSGNFSFQTIEQAEHLAVFLSNACPQPDRIVTGLSEILINAVEHGNLDIGYLEKTELIQEDRWADEIKRRLSIPENQEKFVQVHFENLADKIKIRVTDEGKGFDWRPYLEIDAKRAFDTHGRGIAMARQFSFDSLEFLGKGNEVKITVKVRKGQDSHQD